MRENNSPYMIERLVAGFSYLTMGMAGFIWLIISLFTKAALKPFFACIDISNGEYFLSILLY